MNNSPTQRTHRVGLGQRGVQQASQGHRHAEILGRGVEAMAHRTGQKQESRAKILRGAGRGFRRAGFGGAGVDSLAKEAGVTSGAFSLVRTTM